MGFLLRECLVRSLLLTAVVACLFSTAVLADETPAPATPAAEAPTTPPGNPPMTGPRVLIQTSMGDITLQLDEAHAPITVRNFLRYVRERHFDGTCIYRVMKGFVAQMGSFDAAGRGRGVHEGIVSESNNGLKNLRGTLAMAHGDGPTSTQAEFFINLADNASLDHQASDTGTATGFTVFAQVADGMDVVDKIAEVPVKDGGPMAGTIFPVTPITITAVSVLP
jgi:cyclophilin family peptidyl-prolyl cis-trans isomerase